VLQVGESLDLELAFIGLGSIYPGPFTCQAQMGGMVEELAQVKQANRKLEFCRELRQKSGKWAD
jgi:hypothetical protein